MNPGVGPSRVLYVDLEQRSFRVEDRSDLFSRWLGGVGVAVQLYREAAEKNADPLGRGNVIVFAVGPLTALYPLASKTVAVFKSPLTGNYGESHGGGRSAIAIRSAGFGGIVVKGISDRPIYLVVREGKALFRDAATLWGMRSSYTVGRVLREALPGAGVRSIMRIGRAGERLVRYAGVVTETYRHFGRLGLGAVFGSKKLKALVVHGQSAVHPPSKKMYRDVYDELYRQATKSAVMAKYHELGTAMNILPLNTLGGLPTRNLLDSRFEDAEKISGEELARTTLGRRVACSHCPVACIHLATIRDPYPDEPYFYKSTFVSYDYEPLYALGSMLGISDQQGLLKLLHEVEIEALDTMSTGVVLAWATEALKKGLVGKSEVLFDLDWGKADEYRKSVRHIVDQPNEFYQALARGVEYASDKYGGREFALAFGGNEMPGYHTGAAAHIGVLTGSRHSHLDSAGYSLDQKFKQPPPPRELTDQLVKEEAWRQILSSLVVCFFARGMYESDLTVKALTALGYQIDAPELKRLGEEIYREKQRLKLSEGFDVRGLRIPRRILETSTPHGQMQEAQIREALRRYEEILASVAKN